MNTIIKHFKPGLLFAAILVLFSTACNKDKTKPCLNGSYSFVVTSDWSPQQEIYQIGESLRLHSVFSKTLTDQVDTSITIDYGNSVGIGGNITIHQLDTVQHIVIDAANDFDYNVITGTISTSSTKPLRIKDINYQELSSTYEVDISIIPTTKGIYAIYISDLLSNGLRGDNCTNAGFSNTLANTNQNINLFQYAMNFSPTSAYETQRIYCFRVQ